MDLNLELPCPSSWGFHCSTFHAPSSPGMGPAFGAALISHVGKTCPQKQYPALGPITWQGLPTAAGRWNPRGGAQWHLGDGIHTRLGLKLVSQVTAAIGEPKSFLVRGEGVGGPGE